MNDDRSISSKNNIRFISDISKVNNKLHQLKKTVYQMTHTYSAIDRRNVFIFGCQRSGTTLLGRIFNRDLRSVVLQEINCLTGNNEGGLRLKPYREVRSELEKINAPLVVVKPLVESYRATEILNEIPQSVGIWMFRNYKDVIASNIKRFKSQVEGLKMSITGEPPSWRSEGISQSVKTILEKFYNERMNAADAAALGWFSINNLFFQQIMSKYPKIKLVEYEDFCERPKNIMRSLYSFLNMEYPKWDITREVDKKSLSLGQDIIINQEIEALCIELYKRIKKQYSVGGITNTGID